MALVKNSPTFKATVVKRMTGTVRKFKDFKLADVNHGKFPYDPKEHNLQPIYEKGKGYRMIALEGVKSVKETKSLASDHAPGGPFSKVLEVLNA